MATDCHEIEPISDSSLDSISPTRSEMAHKPPISRENSFDDVTASPYLADPESSHLTLMKAMARFVGLVKSASTSGDEPKPVEKPPSTDEISRSNSQASSLQPSIQRPSSAPHSAGALTLFTLPPTGTGVLYWNLVICFAVAYNLIFIPVRFAFPLFQERFRFSWYVLDALSDVYYLMDILIQLRISFLQQGCLVQNWKVIALHYMHSKRFIIDIVSLLPLDLISISSHLTPYHNYIIFPRFIRLLKIYKIRILVDRVESRSDHPNIIRIVALVIILLTLIHFNGCLYFFISTWLGYGSGPEAWPYPGETIDLLLNGTTIQVVYPLSHILEQYLNCLHWSTQMLTTIGEVNAPTRDIEYIYATFLLLFGVLLFATLVGNVGTIITNLNAARTRFESRLDNVKQYMHNRNINKELKESVLRWFDHLWEKSRGIDEQETLQNLPNKLRARIAINANRKILESNPIYLEGDEGFKIDLMLRFRSELFPPNEIIYEKGHIGNEMYIIRSGTVEISKKDQGQAPVELNDGQHFGINCVINFSEFGRERSETAKTIGFCDLLVLEKKDLLELLIDYPNVKVRLDQRFVREYKNDHKREQKRDIEHVKKYLKELNRQYGELEEEYLQLSEEHNRLRALYPNLAT